MKIVAFGASNSSVSINKQLATYTAKLIENADIEVLDLNDFALPLFSTDIEKQLGQPEAAKSFLAKITSADALVVSFAEHNGSYTAAYKNLFDWCSRIEKKVFQKKPMILLATSPGPGGAKTVLTAATTSIPYFDGEIKAAISVPNFFDNFDINTQTMNNENIKQQLSDAVALLK